MIDRLARLFKGSGAPARRHPSLKDMQLIRAALMEAIADCEGLPPTRLRHKIETAKSVQELWLLRNDAYQQVSQRHTQRVAAERINALIPFFEGIVDPRQLVRIR